MFSPLYQPPKLWQSLYGKELLWRKDVQKKEVWLTFDDGPFPVITDSVLDILKSFDAHATFFVLGKNVVSHPDHFYRTLAEAHSVGNHTYSHTNGWQVTTKQYVQDIEKADALLHNTRLFRPPYGKLTRQQTQYLVQQGFTICMWDVLTHDYDARYDYTEIVEIVKRYARKGSIINFHDSQKASKNVLKALPYCIEFLLHEGYSFQTL